MSLGMNKGTSRPILDKRFKQRIHEYYQQLYANKDNHIKWKKSLKNTTYQN